MRMGSFALLGVSVLLGCVSVPSTDYTHYTLTSSEPVEQHAHYPSILEVQQISAPQWLRTQDMFYQLGYQSEQTVSAFSRARWVAPPAEMLGSLLQERLSMLGAWRAVVGPQAEVEADLTLRLRLGAFQQLFTAPQVSYGLLRATATLVDNRKDRAIAQRIFQYRLKAPSPDAAGGAAALNRANHMLMRDLADWLMSETDQVHKRSSHNGDPAGCCPAP